ncbi:glyoxylase I family protein [Mycobacterium sp. BK086]|uniref:VOC family protein n=1 Tax=Mycobacterium sp. BK086 TaxID=2512165 RepID=UPI0010618AF8|nr:VOC family protein [Mycobacterium sp. BK086]TDO12070.1 glyoxylase I family protein [Mycobacterium sp. BK086]
MRAIHHTAIITSDIDRSLRFWRDGLGLIPMLDHTFTGDWPTLFGVDSDTLRSIFLGDPESPDAGIVELVQFVGTEHESAATQSAPGAGFFLVSLQRDVEPTLAALAALDFTDGVRRIEMPAPGGKTVAMAVITAPDNVRVELIGDPV